MQAETRTPAARPPQPLSPAGRATEAWSNPAPAPPTVRREVFALDEGEVVISFPRKMSPESYSDMKDYFALLMKKMDRWAEIAEAQSGDVDDDPPDFLK